MNEFLQFFSEGLEESRVDLAGRGRRLRLRLLLLTLHSSVSPLTICSAIAFMAGFIDIENTEETRAKTERKGLGCCPMMMKRY